MKIFFDTEFIEDGKTIELLSIGLVREDGKIRWTAEIEIAPGTFFLRLRGNGTARNPRGAPACFYTGPLWVSV